MTVTVRKLGADDWQTGREVRLRALLDAPEAFFRTYAEEAAFDEDRWRGRLAGTEHVTLVAERNGRVVGMVGAGPTADQDHDPQAAMMVSMWVEPASRGEGIAEALTDALTGWCREQGHPRLLLWVYAAAPRAAAFYRRVGFTPTGRTEVFRDDGRPLALMSMAV